MRAPPQDDQPQNWRATVPSNGRHQPKNWTGTALFFTLTGPSRASVSGPTWCWRSVRRLCLLPVGGRGMMVCPSGLLAVVVRSTPWSAVLIVFTGCPPIRADHTAWTVGRIHRMTSSQVDPTKTRPTQFAAPSVSFRRTPVQRGASTAWTRASTPRHRMCTSFFWLILQTGNVPGVRHRP